MRRRSSQPSPWGYLLPLRDGLPTLELRLDKTSVGVESKCTLPLPPALLHLPPTETTLLRVVREEKRVLLYDDTRKKALAVEGKCRSRSHILQHGARIGLGEELEPYYVFVERVSSESFTAPQKILDQFLVAQRLGEGGFGQVYLLFEKKSNYQKRYAMKVVQLADEREKKFAEREKKILRKMNHPCIISTFLDTSLNQQQFFVMEYLPGGDLSVFVNERKLLRESETKLIFFQLALAVKYLHDKNVCHRDIKPANILLQRRDPHTLIKVTDFGLAKNADLSRLTTMAGTELYLAPEVVTDKEYTKQVDLWSMGVLLFFALSGAPPFAQGISEAMRLRYHVMFPADRWHGVSMVALELVQRLLKVIPVQRPSISELVESAWLKDDKMREDAYQLTGLKDIRPEPKISEPASPVARPQKQIKPRPLSGPRGLLEYLTPSPGAAAASPPPYKMSDPIARIPYGGAAVPKSPAAKSPVHKEMTPPRVADLAHRQPQPPTPPHRYPLANFRAAPLPASPARGAPVSPGGAGGGVGAAVGPQQPLPVRAGALGSPATPPVWRAAAPLANRVGVDDTAARARSPARAAALQPVLPRRAGAPVSPAAAVRYSPAYNRAGELVGVTSSRSSSARAEKTFLKDARAQLRPVQRQPKD